MGAWVEDVCYGMDAAVGEFQDEDDDLSEVGPKEIGVALDNSIPSDTVYLQLPLKALRKAKKMWDKASAEDE